MLKRRCAFQVKTQRKTRTWHSAQQRPDTSVLTPCFFSCLGHWLLRDCLLSTFSCCVMLLCTLRLFPCSRMFFPPVCVCIISHHQHKHTQPSTNLLVVPCITGLALLLDVWLALVSCSFSKQPIQLPSHRPQQAQHISPLFSSLFPLHLSSPLLGYGPRDADWLRDQALHGQ